MGESVSRQSAAGYSDKVNPDFAKAPSIAKHEEAIIALLLLFSEHRKKVFSESLLSVDDFFTDLNKRIFVYIENSYNNGDEFADVNELFTPEEVGRITKVKLARMALANNGEEVLLETINALKSSMQKKTAANATTFDDLRMLISKQRNIEG